MLGPNLQGHVQGARLRTVVGVADVSHSFPHSARMSQAFVLKVSTAIDDIHVSTRVYFGMIPRGDACLTA